MENKYIKYKYKYLQLKNKLIGGVGTPPPKAGVLSTESDAVKASLAVESEADRMKAEAEILAQLKAEQTEILAQIKSLEDQSAKYTEIHKLKMELGRIKVAQMQIIWKRAPKLQIHGAYGCAYTPPFKCINSHTCINSSMANSVRCVNGIGKVMNPRHAHNEFNIYDLLKVDEIDPDFRYHFPKPHMCNPDMVESERAKCPVIDRSQPPVMLIYDNGKLDLYALIEISKKDTISLLAKLKQILRGLLNILEGIILFNKNSICHNDIKTPNITTSLSSSDNFHDLHMRMIDFGLSIKYNVAITPGNIFNDINGNDFKRIKRNIKDYYDHNYNIDILFAGLLDSSAVTDINISYIENSVNIFFKHIASSSHYNLQILNLLYNHPQINWTRDKVATELKDLYKTNTINAIILQYLKTHDYYQFALLLITISSIIKNQKVLDACIKFICNTNSVHYNPFERCRSVDLIEHYNEFLRDIERI
jgi:serine/threonine protein kinase